MYILGRYGKSLCSPFGNTSNLSFPAVSAVETADPRPPDRFTEQYSFDYNHMFINRGSYKLQKCYCKFVRREQDAFEREDECSTIRSIGYQLPWQGTV